MDPAGAPWWGVPVIAGGFLLLGAVLGFVFNRLNEDRKAKQAAAIRWDSELREIGAEVLTTVNEMTRTGAVLEVRTLYVRGGKPDRATLLQAERQTNEHVESLAGFLVECQLIAPPNVYAALNRISRSAWDFQGTLYPNSSSAGRVDAAHKQLLRDVWEFVETLRAHLGVETGLPKPDSNNE
ncbi:hypothetical protein [Leifsonia sp. NPDC077715]|uniref:hypothetical protein n=1 Tax=Leifsonia sp. NPDC077715 TaxID=3155539 RepID=UPI00343AD0A5